MQFVQFDKDQLLTSSEVGQLLQVNPSSVKKWVDDGLLAAFRTPGGHRRIRAADLIAFLDAHRMPIPLALRDTARKRMLIVDDDAIHLKAFARAFERYGDEIEIITSSDGVEALVLVGALEPHVVVLDVLMPLIDGLEVCRRLKANPKTRGISVVIVSGCVDAALERKAAAAGAVCCLLKPIRPAAVMEVVAELARSAVTKAHA